MTYQPKIETDGTVTHLGARIGEVTLDNPRRDGAKISCNWMRSDVDQDEFREMKSELEDHRFRETLACPECIRTELALADLHTELITTGNTLNTIIWMKKMLLMETGQ